MAEKSENIPIPVKIKCRAIAKTRKIKRQAPVGRMSFSLQKHVNRVIFTRFILVLLLLLLLFNCVIIMYLSFIQVTP